MRRHVVQDVLRLREDLHGEALVVVPLIAAAEVAATALITAALTAATEAAAALLGEVHAPLPWARVGRARRSQARPD